MNMPLGVLLVLAVVSVLVLCLILAFAGIVLCIRRRARKTAIALVIVSAAIAVLCVWAVYWVAPKGGRTIAQLDLPDGRTFVVRHYRFGWTEYPKVRFYARNKEGAWTSFMLIAELVNPNDTSLVMDASRQEVEVAPIGGWYRIKENGFLNIDGSWGPTRQLPPGVEPGAEDIYDRAAYSQ
ncbi:MAG: hypothetical protein IT365_13685 [Candidatus Hydrogenedentes bacterium]|nr:hypothetical protein [Candidatus Hydrogenedentota bacterium]